MLIGSYIAKYIRQIIAKEPRQALTSEEYNDILNLLITQGDYNAEALQAVMDRLELIGAADFSWILSLDDVQPSLDLKLDKAGGTMTGNLTIESTTISGTVDILPVSGKLRRFFADDTGAYIVALDAADVNNQTYFGVRDAAAVSNISDGLVLKRRIAGVVNEYKLYGEHNFMPNKHSWKLVQTYNVAGTYTFTAPDLYNGASYELGVFIIGGGGSGAAHACVFGAGSLYSYAAGGAAGSAKVLVMTAVPGQQYTVVVGAGGAARVHTPTVTDADSGTGIAGANGGTSSFNGVTAAGGAGGSMSGGEGYNVACDGAIGGQCSVAPNQNLTTGNAPFGGVLVKVKYNSGSNGLALAEDDVAMQPLLLQGYNPFNERRYLGAGGSARDSNVAQLGATLGDGLVSGAGAAVGAGTATAGSATSPGSGGGAVSKLHTSDVSQITSGAGAAGAVFVYTRMAV